jgi:hypothetical protein
MKQQNNPPLCNVKDTKEFFSSAMKNMFAPVIKERSIYTEGDVSGTLRNAIADHLYIETYVRNYGNTNTPSGDTMFRLLKEIASESGSHRRKGSDMNKKRKTVRTGIETIDSLLDLIIKKAISMGAFSTPVNVAIDEHDHPYYGADSRYLIGVGSKKFRGTDKAYRFATLESVKRGERFVLSVMRRDQLDGIDNSKEVKTLIEHAVDLGIRINIILMDRGYLDAGVMNNVDTMGMKYIVPARDNPKVLGLKKKDTNWSERKDLSFLVVNDSIDSGREVARSNFVHVKYHKDGKLHDFCFYTNIEVTEDNVENLAETYRERWSIENGYGEKMVFEEKTHSPDIGVRYFIFYFSVLIYNLWILINLMRRLSGQKWIVFIDFVIDMKKGRWGSITGDYG